MQTRTILTSLFSVLTVSFSIFNCPAQSPKELVLTLLHFTEPNGVTFTGEYTGEGLGNLSGGIQPGTVYEGLLKFTLGLDLKKILDWDGASIYASTLYPHGNGLSEQYTGDFNILSNIDAYDSFRLFELWIQQKFFGDKASIRVGQMSADVEFYQSKWSNLFINSCFGTFPTITFGTTLPAYPVGGLGARLELHPSSSTFLRTAVFDSNPGRQDTDDKHGTRFHLNPSAGVIVLSEVAYQITPSVENGGKEESYIVGGYYDSRRFTANFLDPTHTSNGGLYAIVDRILYRKTPYVNEQSSFSGLGGFSSFGVAPADRNVVSFYADCGVNYNGPFPARDNDVFGVALSYTRISRDYLVNNIPVHFGHETVLEATYRFQVNDHLYLQPDFQYIFNPGAFQHLSNAFVVGVRYDLTF